MILEGFDRESFWQCYWQQKPLLIKYKGDAFQDPIKADELAGLSCEPEVESRLIVADAGNSWQLRHGPFEADFFATLGEKNWTLLVQAVDQFDVRINALKSRFDFLYSWRIDDIMVSFASDGGGVGPHYDHYDVFLIQGMGCRQWQIGQRCDATSALRTDTELRVLQEFTPESEFLLEPGDILYLPARFAHNGVSKGESLCYSVGFRAPSYAEMIQGFTDLLIDNHSEDYRFEDPRAAVPSDSSRIPAQAVSEAFQKIIALTNDPAAFSDYFGSAVTQSRYPERVHPTTSEVTLSDLRNKFINESQVFVIKKNSSSRFAYFENLKQIKLFVDGEQFICHSEQLSFVTYLCQTPWHETLRLTGWLEDNRTGSLVVELINHGSLVVQRR